MGLLFWAGLGAAIGYVAAERRGFPVGLRTFCFEELRTSSGTHRPGVQALGVLTAPDQPKFGSNEFLPGKSATGFTSSGSDSTICRIYVPAVDVSELDRQKYDPNLL